MTFSRGDRVRLVDGYAGWSDLVGREGSIVKEIKDLDAYTVEWDNYGDVAFYTKDLQAVGPSIIEDWRL